MQEIRRAGHQDVPAIVALLADDTLGSAREEPGPPLPQQYFDAFAAIEADPNQLLAVVEEDGEVVGCLQLSFIPGLSHRAMWRGQIEGVRIASSRRGGGLGRQMILWATERCRERGCGSVQLTSNKSRVEAIRFYERLGFEPSHEGLKLGLR